MIRGIDHIAIAVQDLGTAVRTFSLLFAGKEPEFETIPDQKVRVAIFQLDNCRIELLEPTDPGSPVAKFLEKRGEGLHHIALVTDRIRADLERLAGQGFVLIDSLPREGAGSRKIAFLHPSSAHSTLIELCEAKT
jgi:methylmalonyl-CoA epimerase